MASNDSRPWYRWHWLTWLVVGMVVWALIAAQFEPRAPLSIGDLGGDWSTFGWPLPQLEGVQEVFKPGQFRHVRRDLNLAGNCALWILFVGSTALVCETWLRNGQRAQFRLSFLLIVTAILSILMALMNVSWWVSYRAFPNSHFAWSLITWSDLTQPLRWPLLFALACTLYTLGALAFWLCRRAFLAIAGPRR